MPKTFLIDENLSPSLVLKFKHLGYQAVAVRDIGLKGVEDTEIVQWAKDNNAIIITGDRDFGELWYWFYAGNIGIIILRLSSQSLEEQEKVVDYLHEANLLKHTKLTSALIISSGHHHRIRISK